MDGVGDLVFGVLMIVLWFIVFGYILLVVWVVVVCCVLGVHGCDLLWC